jgi:hypothetical protein
MLMNNEPYHEVESKQKERKQAKRLEAMATMLKLAGYAITPPPLAAH